MKRSHSLSPASKLTVTALLAAALGFAIQIVSGIDVPTVPPGLIILVLAATVVALLPWRWAPVVGTFAGLFLSVGFFASGARSNLLDPSRFGVLIGAWIQFIALIVAVAMGLVATIQNYRKRPRT
jgi:energy-coupling factor transporter transmembrane protein EcfT